MVIIWGDVYMWLRNTYTDDIPHYLMFHEKKE